MESKYKISNEINFLLESLHVAVRSASYKGVFEEKEFHLIEKEDNFIKSAYEIDQEFADVHNFYKEVLKVTVPLFSEKSYWWVLSQTEKVGIYNTNYILDLTLNTNYKSFSKVTYEDFIRMNLENMSDLLYKEGRDQDLINTLDNKKFRGLNWQASNLEYNLGDIFILLDNLSCSDEKKVAILKIFSDSKNVFKDFKEKLEKCEEVLKSNLFFVEDRLKETYEAFTNSEVLGRIEEIFKLEDTFQNIGEEYKKKIEGGITIYTGPAGYNYGTIQISRDPDNFPIIYIGVLLLPLENSLKKILYSKERIIEQTKALGDNTRFEILEILSERPYFLKELAEKMNLSSASLSHHISILAEAAFIVPEITDRKTYYKLNRKAFKTLSGYFEKLSKGNQDV